MKSVTIDWDAVELLPKRTCCVCARLAVPWGRTLDDEFFCSRHCGEEHEAARRPVARSAVSWPYPIPAATGTPAGSRASFLH